MLLKLGRFEQYLNCWPNRLFLMIQTELQFQNLTISVRNSFTESSHFMNSAHLLNAEVDVNICSIWLKRWESSIYQFNSCNWKWFEMTLTIQKFNADWNIKRFSIWFVSNHRANDAIKVTAVVGMQWEVGGLLMSFINWMEECESFEWNCNEIAVGTWIIRGDSNLFNGSVEPFLVTVAN